MMLAGHDRGWGGDKLPVTTVAMETFPHVYRQLGSMNLANAALGLYSQSPKCSQATDKPFKYPKVYSNHVYMKCLLDDLK